MGKQINYWLGYEDFLKIAQTALDCGCIIIKKVSGKLIYKCTLDIVTEHEHNYWFYVPEAEGLSVETLPFDDKDIQGYSPVGNTLIEAGFSFRNDKSKTITRSRLFVISGYYDKQGEYISRPERVTKIYNRLVRIAKKVAPLTELTEKYVNTSDNAYLQEVEWKHREYVTPEYLHLKESDNYKLIGQYGISITSHLFGRQQIRPSQTTDKKNGAFHAMPLTAQTVSAHFNLGKRNALKPENSGQAIFKALTAFIEYSSLTERQHNYVAPECLCQGPPSLNDIDGKSYTRNNFYL